MSKRKPPSGLVPSRRHQSIRPRVADGIQPVLPSESRTGVQVEPAAEAASESGRRESWRSCPSGSVVSGATSARGAGWTGARSATTTARRLVCCRYEVAIAAAAVKALAPRRTATTGCPHAVPLRCLSASPASFAEALTAEALFAEALFAEALHITTRTLATATPARAAAKSPSGDQPATRRFHDGGESTASASGTCSLCGTPR